VQQVGDALTGCAVLCCGVLCLQGKGVDTIACISVNDAFVMDAWGKSVGAGDKVMMLADGNGQFAKALGVELDLNDKGLGLRSRRYALLADDQVGWPP
jgi:peroxiredoxin